jgi:hypothetical protein
VDDDVGNFKTFPSSLLISLAKSGFNFVSYSKLVSETHDVCHYQAKKTFFPSKDSVQPDSALQQRICFISSFVFPVSPELFCRSLT